MTISGQADRLSLSAGSDRIQPILHSKNCLIAAARNFAAGRRQRGGRDYGFFRKNISKYLSQVWNGKINAKDS